MFTKAAEIARKQKYEEKCKKIFSTIDVEEFTNYYNSHYDKETREHFGLTSTQLKRYLELYNITKTKERFILLSRRARLEKYGDPTFRNIEKNKMTKLQRYGDPNYNNSAQISKTYKNKTKQELSEINDKRRQTCIERFGYESNSQSDISKNKLVQTNLERYGLPFYCMTTTCRETSFNRSSVNILLEKLLHDENIRYIREYWIGRFSFDAYLPDYNICIEMDPFPFHNITWSPIGEPKDKYYHQRKSKVAYDLGIRCIHVFDWMSLHDIIKNIDDFVSFNKASFEEPNKFIYDTKIKQLVSKENEYTVIIYDDGVIYE